MRAQQQQPTLRERTIFRLDMLLPLVFVDKYKNRNINDKQPRVLFRPLHATRKHATSSPLGGRSSSKLSQPRCFFCCPLRTQQASTHKNLALKNFSL